MRLSANVTGQKTRHFMDGPRDLVAGAFHGLPYYIVPAAPLILLMGRGGLSSTARFVMPDFSAKAIA